MEFRFIQWNLEFKDRILDIFTWFKLIFLFNKGNNRMNKRIKE